MKKSIKIIISILCLSLILSMFLFETRAAVGLDTIDDPDSYIVNNGDNTEAIAIGNVVVWIVRTIGQTISVIMLLVIGIKYIIGSVEEKAEYKQTMWPYILGAVLIFSGATLTDLIYSAFQS